MLSPRFQVNLLTGETSFREITHNLPMRSATLGENINPFLQNGLPRRFAAKALDRREGHYYFFL